MWQYHQLLFGFLANGHLPRVSSQSRLSANDFGDNKVKPEGVNRSPGIYIPAKVEDRLMRVVQSVIASNGVPYLQMMSVDSHSMLRREREREKLAKKRKNWEKDGKKERIRIFFHWHILIQGLLLSCRNLVRQFLSFYSCLYFILLISILWAYIIEHTYLFDLNNASIPFDRHFGLGVSVVWLLITRPRVRLPALP